MPTSAGKLVQFQGEKMHGNFVAGYQDFLKDVPKVSVSDADSFFKEVTSIKGTEDIKASEVASKFSDERAG